MANAAEVRLTASAREEMAVLWGLSWPVVVGLLGHMGTSVVDVVMVGGWGKEALASVALAHMWCHSMVLLGRGILQGSIRLSVKPTARATKDVWLGLFKSVWRLLS